MVSIRKLLSRKFHSVFLNQAGLLTCVRYLTFPSSDSPFKISRREDSGIEEKAATSLPGPKDTNTEAKLTVAGTVPDFLRKQSSA